MQDARYPTTTRSRITSTRPRRNTTRFRGRKRLLLCAWLAAPALAWGPQGHRVAGMIAEQHLSDNSRAAIAAIIGSESLASASTWADRMRSDPSPFWQREAGAYHYVKASAGVGYRPGSAPRAGDAYTALSAFARDLASSSSAPEQRQRALRFSIHIVQDLHQPLHAGVREDRGGNDFRVDINGRSSNLHRVWDSDMIAAAERSDRAWTRYLKQAFTESEWASWHEADPLVWIQESASLSESIYPDSSTVDRRYLDRHQSTVDRRLAQAGLRTAAYLNQLFDRVPSPPAGSQSQPATLWQRLKHFLKEVIQ